MAKQIVYLVVERQLVYNDYFYNIGNGERIVKAYRSQEKARQVAAELSAQNERTIDFDEEGTSQNFHVVEAVIEVEDKKE